MKEALNDFIFQSKYAKYNSILGRKETFEESVDRIMNMHITYLTQKYPEAFKNAEFSNDFMEAFESYKSKKVFGSQRALQFGGSPILNKHCRQYNCAFTYADRLEVFKEIEWVLLCGCGAGVSVEKQHVIKLPKMLDKLSEETKTFQIEDSIEGWALAIQQIINYYFIKGTPYPKFDYSLIRPSGSLISGGFVAPGPDGLRNAIINIQNLLDRVYKGPKKLTPLNVTDIIAYCADSVLSGGVRRSAVIILFDPDDEDMFNSKTGDWFYSNPQRGRYNASAVLERDSTSWETFIKIFKATKQFGEPGFYWRSDKGLGCNPCGEIGFKPTINGKSGWQFCNLVTISGKEMDNEEDFYKACKDAATIATIQAAYQSFPFLGSVTEELVKNDPLIGVSISGIMCNLEVLLHEETLQEGARIVKEQNSKIAKILGINESSRCTTVKPRKS
jgi:ribonucleoside-diphosphate reductase alpha chain